VSATRDRLPGLAAAAAFFLVIFLADWLVCLASLAVLKLDPAPVPESFFIAYLADQPDSRGSRYRALAWERYASTRHQARTLLLPDPSGAIPSKGNSLSFRVLKDEGFRQLVEVKYDGAHRSRSRYHAYADRVVPISYRRFGWGDERGSQLGILAVMLGLAVFAAVLAAVGAQRLADGYRCRHAADCDAGLGPRP
jgi:hypothetical protein